MSWTRIDWAVIGWFVAAVIVSWIPNQPAYFGIVPRLNALCGVIALFVFALHAIGRTVRNDVTSYTPTDAVAAKQINEQLKLTATTINAIAIAIASAFAIAEFARNDNPNVTFLLIYAGVALHFHTQARALLGLLKDESAR